MENYEVLIMKYKVEINQRIGKAVNKKWLKKIVQRVFHVMNVKNAEISVAIIGNQEMKRLNKEWRGKNKTTDVLSFTYQIPDAKYKIPLNGEIIICYPQAACQAKERGHSVKEEIKTLLVHGLLHLCGFNHEKSLKEERRMESMQSKLLSGLKF